MKNTPPSLLCDFYKISHREQYPHGTQKVYSTWTPRSNKYHSTSNEVVVFGAQGFIKQYLLEFFNTNFFCRKVEEVTAEYERYIKFALGVEKPDSRHLKALRVLGYLPLEIKCIPEGVSVPLRVPMLTIVNTHEDFYWLTNFIETLFSCEMWLASTAATIAKEYKTTLDKYAEETGEPDFVKFQGHDFSMRGMGCLGASEISGAGHLLSFVGTDTIPAIWYLEQYYNANIENELVGTSIPATEHSVMCAGIGHSSEFKTYERLITEVYPSGFVSIVSDTMDLWSCIKNIIEPLKDKILARDGKVVIRPDSGDPVEIICGIPEKYIVEIDGVYTDTRTNVVVSEMEKAGLVSALWVIFGGSVNDKGYRVLDSHIGAIYGDSITLERCKEICSRLKAAGFASTNVVYGIGSYTYQYNTRDSFGFALKSTACVINEKEYPIFKNPKTDDGTKKSNRGAVAVVIEEGGMKCVDNLPLDNTHEDLMRTIFVNGRLVVDDSLAVIRERLAN